MLESRKRCGNSSVSPLAEKVSLKKQRRAYEKKNEKKELELQGSVVHVKPSYNQALEEIRDKYENLKHLRETEAERLLQEATKLALEERKTYEKVVTKLKEDIETLSEKNELLQENNAKLMKGVHTRSKEIKSTTCNQNEMKDDLDEISGRKEELDLSRANQLLSIYQLLTSISIRLIEHYDCEESDDSSEYSDVTCQATDSSSGRLFEFKLSIPKSSKYEIEYLPISSTGLSDELPSYLREELSFKRNELSKFMKTVLHVITKT